MKSKNSSYLLNRSVLIILLTTVVSFHAKAFQADFEEGYIVKSPNDTIIGYIEIKDHIFNTKNCVFKKTIDASPITYSPGELVAYGKADKRYFRSFSIISPDSPVNAVFLECIVGGKVSLFFFKERYFIEYNNYIEELVEVRDEIQKDGRSFIVKRPAYRSTLQKAMSDCKEAYKNISTVTLKVKSLVELFNKYYECIELRLTTYESNSQQAYLRIGLSGGLMHSTMHFRLRGTSDDLSFVPSVWIELAPAFSKRIRIKSGLAYYSSIYKVDDQYQAAVSGLRHDFSRTFSRIELPLLFKCFFSSTGSGVYFVTGIGVNKIITFDDHLKTTTYPGNVMISEKQLPQESGMWTQAFVGMGYEMPLAKRSLFFEINASAGQLSPGMSGYEGSELNAFILTAGFPLTRNR